MLKACINHSFPESSPKFKKKEWTCLLLAFQANSFGSAVLIIGFQMRFAVFSVFRRFRVEIGTFALI